MSLDTHAEDYLFYLMLLLAFVSAVCFSLSAKVEENGWRIRVCCPSFLSRLSLCGIFAFSFLAWKICQHHHEVINLILATRK